MLAKVVYNYLAPMSVLHVAEKNSIAKEVANILSNSSKRTGFTLSKYNPIYEFQCNSTPMKFTSVRGHIFEHELPAQCRNWRSYDNKKILLCQVPMIKKLGPDMKDVVKNIQKLARENKELVLWLDCDREGEAIAFEVIEICQRVNPRIKIQRARFSAVTPTDIWNAYNNLVQPNPLEASAVNYRIQIDLRSGCAFTRFQTVTFQNMYELVQNTFLSYGPCQMPTLSFVVDRYLQIKNFKSEKYWFLEAVCVISDTVGIDFKWNRKKIKDEVVANQLIYDLLAKFEDGNVIGKVLERKSTAKKKYRPFPLTTVKFQKLATDKLRISSAKAMQIAEKLYQKGFISYPRTQTNAFPKTMNLRDLVGRLQSSAQFGQYVNKLVGEQNKFFNPKVGNQDDQAHSPIHPVKVAERTQLTNEEWRVYDLIVRHFLACCSNDAKGEEFQVRADIGGEEFKASYLSVLEKNYLQIYTIQRWVETSFPADIPEQFPVMLTLAQGKTTPPGYLTEADLIDLMEKNQIGTDATIHEHIETIQNRQYAIKTDNTFKPTNLGAALVQTYQELEIDLPKCQIRSNIQKRMNDIASGNLDQAVATKETLDQMVPTYEKLMNIREQWLKTMKKYIDGNSDLKKIEMTQRTNSPNSYGRNIDRIQACRCPSCQQPALVRYSPRTQSYFIGCSTYPDCKWTCSLPSYIEKVRPTEQSCPKCTGSKLVEIKAKQGAIIDPFLMKIRFQELQMNEQQFLKVCLTPKCDSDLYDSLEDFGNSYRNRTQNWQQNTVRNHPQSPATTQYNPQPGSLTNQERMRGNNSTQPNTNFRQNKEIVCFKCNQPGHIAPDCPGGGGVRKGSQTSFKSQKTGTNNSKLKCYNCGQAGHFSTNCPNPKSTSFRPNQFKGKKSVEKRQQKKEKKTCPQCGAEGRHPRNSTCGMIKRKKSSNKPDDSP